MIEPLYNGWTAHPDTRFGAELGVEMDQTSPHFGWLVAKTHDGRFVILADMKPVAARICADRA